MCIMYYQQMHPVLLMYLLISITSYYGLHISDASLISCVIGTPSVTSVVLAAGSTSYSTHCIFTWTHVCQGNSAFVEQTIFTFLTPSFIDENENQF